MMFVPLEAEERRREGRYVGYPWTEARVRTKCPQVWPISIALFGEKRLTCEICPFATQRLLRLLSSAPILIFPAKF